MHTSIVTFLREKSSFVNIIYRLWYIYVEILPDDGPDSCNVKHNCAETEYFYINLIFAFAVVY
jgi:hypothetical protein